ncbi:MAG: hypothetical protein KAJ19_03815 [Gammaproteobacteria bacterium]|nr:hypothetical protein [Gammaproteobacteria bacterium]
MRLFNKPLTLAIAITPLLSSPYANADASVPVPLGKTAKHYYGIGFIGKATWDLGAEYTNKHLVWSLLVGRRTRNKSFELEVAAAQYEQYGQTDYNASHLTFSVLKYQPIFSSADIYGKIGLNSWITSVDNEGIRTKSDDGINIALSAGLQFKFKPDKKNIIIRFEGKVLPDISNGVDEGDIRQFTTTIIGYY